MIGVNGGLIGTIRTPSLSLAPGVWTLNEQVNSQRVGLWPTLLDADAVVYLAAVEAADGQPLETAVRDATNAFVVGCKLDGTWNAIKAACIMSGARTLAGALVPLVGTAPTNNNFVSGDYNRKNGLTGNGTNKYLNSNRNNNADPQNSQHLSVYVSTASTSGANFPNYIACGADNTGASVIGRLNNNGNFNIRSRNGSNESPTHVTGFVGISRAASATFTFRASSTNTIFTRTSQTPFNGNIGVFIDGVNFAGTTFNTGTISFYSIGESLDLALLNTRVNTLISAFAAAIP